MRVGLDRRLVVAVAELALDVDEVLASGQPEGGGGVAPGVQRHGAQAGLLRGWVPFAGDGVAVYGAPVVAVECTGSGPLDLEAKDAART